MDTIFKFQLGQDIYFMSENKAICDEVVSRKYVDNKWENTYIPYGHACIMYSTRCYVFDVPQHNAFATKEELLASL